MHIEMKDIIKSFGTNQVLHGASIDIAPGEVHALMGENGAGKSTMMKILTGVHEKDGGSVKVDGQEVAYAGPKEAEENGISFIHQELNVLSEMSIEENLFLNKELFNKFGLLDKKAMRRKARTALEVLGMTLPPETLMSQLSVGQQQMVEICKALMANVQVIIMDEPTAALTDTETRKLFEVIADLQKRNVSIVYISHRMEEIFQISDRITVMRDGEYIGTKLTSETNDDELVKMMIGRELKERYPKREPVIGEVVLKVDHLTSGNRVKNVSFELRAGEVLGFSGLMGSGRSEIMHAIFGSAPRDNGTITIKDQLVNIQSPEDAMRNGIGFITEDRKSEGLLLDKSIRENLALTNLTEVSRKGFINKFAEKAISDSSIKMFQIKTPHAEYLTGDLSGGNQQKVVIAKWVLTNPGVLILDEPTRGVDVGAKEEIYQIINDLAKQGVAIIMVSSDLPEVIGMSDRVAVMREGELKGVLDRELISDENIMTLATGGKIDGIN